MSIALMPQRPPYVEFEYRAVEDRNATIANKEGKAVFRDVAYAIIRPMGSKDVIEREAEPWLAHIAKQAGRREWPQAWVDFFNEQYAKWKAGQEIGPDGTHVKNWAAIGPAQAQALIAARILTVEDLAVANEEALQRVGMGARALKARAQAWLETAAQHGTAEELAALRVETEQRKQENSDLRDRLAKLEARLSADEEPGGRKRKAS